MVQLLGIIGLQIGDSEDASVHFRLNLILSGITDTLMQVLNIGDAPADKVGIVGAAADNNLLGGNAIEISGVLLDDFETIRCAEIRQTVLQTVKDGGFLLGQGGIVELMGLRKTTVSPSALTEARRRRSWFSSRMERLDCCKRLT